MRSKQEFSTILVELDCLLDTRMATVFTYRPLLVPKLLEKNYHQRLIDNFYPGYNDDYANRNTSILKNAIVTPVADIIKEFTDNTYYNSLATPFVRHTKVQINTWPYDIKDGKWLTAAIVAITDNKADVELVSMKPEEVTPQYLKNHISVAIMYDYTKWLDIHTSNEYFKLTQCPAVKLVAPAIYFKDVSKEELPDNPFITMEEFTSILIGLTLMSSEVFSFKLKIKKEKDNQPE